MGMLLQFVSVANGDPSKVKVDVIEKKPFIKISLHGLTIDNAEKQIEAFIGYLEEIFDCFEEKMPKILEKMNSLVERAPEVQQEAQA
jgi:predicted choloylglycine hydrolase